jgi:zinc transporter
MVLTLRAHPLLSTDRLRSEAREGLRIVSGPALLCRLIEYQIEAIRKLTDTVTRDIDQAEDHILAGRIAEQRQSLGRARRMCAHLRRSFGAQSIAMQKLIARPPAWLDREDLTRLASLQEDLAFAVGESAALHERAKLLQEELASRVAEQTGRNLYVLTIFSAVFMPMTLLSGVFGMNVAGLPGLEGKGSFWWVMLLILVSGGVTLVALLRKLPK